jgi:hypothetical protein
LEGGEPVCIAKDGSGNNLVVKGDFEGKRYHWVQYIVLFDGKFAYVVDDGESHFLVQDEVEGKRYDYIEPESFAKVDGKPAYSGRYLGSEVVV